ncbi:MAG: radical SAM family heme chaperone HemW [Phycisphaerales bacterium]|nr:MAG: radical SAM family heme chaperone HemW [Phycisphaerales bacterium]
MCASSQLPPAALYIHIPYCAAKCGYCDFYSVPIHNEPTNDMLAALQKELVHRVGTCGHRIRTVFIGGGTPTILATTQLGQLLTTLAEVLRDHEPIEFTVEANPETITAEKAHCLADAGVNRVSMGAQSFDAPELEVLERRHGAADVPQAVAALRRAGVGNINLDLIFGIPGQTLESWRSSLDHAIELGVDHLSCYGLTYEPGTELTAQRDRGLITPCHEGVEAEMFSLAIDHLAGAGFEQYEISNYAKPGRRCLHNLMYWRNEPYVGIGPSAAGCTGGRRYKNVADVGTYIRLMRSSGHAESESETIDRAKLVNEMILMQLRLSEGLSISVFRSRMGLDPLQVFEPALTRLVESRLLFVTEEHIALTRSGMLVANRVMTELACACESL